MADEVFALSPISARAAQPSEEDYAAIHAAFMETSRGRWFLGEYAKRNRNADTRLVLDAVARIEESLGAQKQAAAEADLAEALAAIRTAVTEAQSAANAGLDGLALDERLAPVARGVRIIREISWRWRETGADGRICDILDSQVAAIESSAGQLSAGEARAAIDQAFAAIEARIDEFSRSEAPPEQARHEAGDTADANVVPFPAPPEEATAPAPETAAIDEPVAEAPAAEAAAPIADDAVGAIEVVDETAADAHDEAMLDLIAAEMSAPQPVEDDLEMAVAGTTIAEPPVAVVPALATTEAVAPAMESVAVPVAAPVQPEPRQPETFAAVAPEVEPSPATTQIGEAETSIGAAVIASGILKKPNLPANDLLAPIRRMSQAEKIAFFS